MNRIITFILLLHAITLVGQVPDTTSALKIDSTYSIQRNIDSFIGKDTISCINYKENIIIFNEADWSSLFQSMKMLLDTIQGNQNIVSIVHLGDSHVQAGMFTEAIRIPMQSIWGNAGRGLIIPLKITKTNEPLDYRISSSTKWQFSRCLGKQFSNDVGVGGILIEPVNSSIDLTFSTKSRYGEDVKFNKLSLLHSETYSFPQLNLTDTLSGLNIHSPIAGETSYTWDNPTNTINLRGTNNGYPSNATIYGAILENNKKGLLVHTIGNNSATYECYNRIDNYGKKLARLNPHLVIISLGTNESVSSVFKGERLEQEIDNLISSIKKECPSALFLLTTPADNKLRRVRRNKKKRRIAYYINNINLPYVVETIKEYGKKNNIAVWDWYTISGGKGAYDTWIKEDGMRKDHIHYTPKGYTLQGNLLFHSISNAYEQHIQ